MNRPPPANPVRVFAALELPEAIQRRLAAGLASLRAGAPAGSVRWVRPEGIHLTLQFYGEVDPARVPALEAVLAQAAAGSTPLTINLAGLGAFPNPARPRVVWVGVSGDLAALQALQAAVEAGSRPLGFPPEARGFNPHLTLGRVNQPVRPADQRRLTELLARAVVPGGAPATLRELCLMRSDLQRGGAVYRRLFAAALAGGRNP